MIVIESGFAGITYDLKTPRIGAYPLTGTVTGSTSTAGYDASLAANQWTYQFWRPTAMPATWEINFGATKSVSYFGIAAHNLGTKAATVDFQTWNGSAWVTVASHSPTDDTPILCLCATKSCTKARISISGASVPDIGVIQFGSVTEFPQRAAYVGRSDYSDLVEVAYRNVQSDGGHVLGRYYDRKSQSVKLAVENLSDAWKTSTLDPLITHFRDYAVFIADRPSAFPASVAFGRTAGAVTPDRGVANSAVSVNVSMDFICHVV